MRNANPSAPIEHFCIFTILPHNSLAREANGVATGWHRAVAAHGAQLHITKRNFGSTLDLPNANATIHASCQLLEGSTIHFGCSAAAYRPDALCIDRAIGF